MMRGTNFEAENGEGAAESRSRSGNARLGNHVAGLSFLARRIEMRAELDFVEFRKGLDLSFEDNYWIYKGLERATDFLGCMDLRFDRWRCLTVDLIADIESLVMAGMVA